MCTTMFARGIALRLGCGFRYLYRLTQYWHTTSSKNIWPCAYFERNISTCFAAVNLNLRAEGLQHTHFWRFSTISRGLESSHSLDKMLKEQDDVNAMLQTIAEKFPLKNLDPFEAVECFKIIRTFMYNKMLYKMAVFQNQPPKIVFARVLHDQIKAEMLMSLFQNQYLQGLLNQIQRHISQFTPANNAELFACLATLGISFEHSVMQELISLFYDEKYPVCLNDLAMIIDHIKDTAPRWDVFILQVSIPKLQKFYETNICIENTSCSLKSLATLLLRSFNFIQCSKMRDWYLERLLSMAEDDSCMTLDSVRLILIMLTSTRCRSLPLSCATRLAVICFKEIEKKFHELEPYQIGDIACAGWQLVADKKLDSLHILEKVHFLALNMLEKVSASATLTEILRLLLGVRWQMLDRRKREQLEALVVEHLEEANEDELAKVVQFTLCNQIENRTYHSALDATINGKMGRIMAVSSVFMKISNYYCSFSTPLPVYETVMYHMQNTQMMLETKEFVYLAQMVLCTFSEDKPFPRLIIDKIEAMISQFTLFGITVILRGLDGFNKNKHTHAQILDVHILLDKAFLQKIETTELQELCDVTYRLGYLVDSTVRHADKFNLLFEKMAKLMQFMTTNQFHEIVSIIYKKQLYKKVVLDSLTYYLIRHNEVVMDKDFVMLVVAIAKSGYQPQEYSVFTKLCTEMTLKHFNKLKIQEQISLAFGLCILQICPQEILCRIFSIEYQMLLDKHRAQAGLDSRFRIMFLNRCAVLEYPQLNIPWFHGGFESKLGSSYFVVANRRFTDLQGALSQVLGGPEFFRKNVVTPYFIPICVELFLDENKRPVYYVEAKQAQARNAPYQPIAILVNAEQPTRINEGDKQLNGIMQTKIRQLEIRGYKVVVIHYSEWNSTAMLDNDERVKYLKKKLFTI